MADPRTLHDIAKALRALQIKALEAESVVPHAFLAMTESVIHDMALKAEKESVPLAETPAKMMRRSGER